MDWEYINIYNILLNYLDKDQADSAAQDIKQYLEDPKSMTVVLR